MKFATARPKLLLLSALFVAGSLLAWFGEEPFRQWQERRLMDSADGFLAKNDIRSAHLVSQEALLKNPKSVRACAMIAHLAELQRMPAAIFWRQRIIELQPGVSAPLLNLATTATAFGETFIAEQALVQVPERERDSVVFRRAAAALAIALKQYAAAADHFQQALKLEPWNEALQLDLATVQLAIAEPAQCEAARAALERLRTNPQFRLSVLRALANDARRSGDAARAMQLADELNSAPGAAFGDHLLHLEELQRAGGTAFDSALAQMQAQAAASPSLIFETMTWMNAHGLVSQALEWSESLPVLMRLQMPVPLALAEACTAIKDWKRLGKIVNEADWDDLEFLRLAVRARCIDETASRPRGPEFKTAWERAMHASNGNPAALSMLARLVNGWGWKDEAVQASWLVARNNTGQRPALKMLYEIHAAERNTRELYRVARRVYEIEPASLVARNNVAMLALLLGEDEEESHRLAGECYRLSPSHPVIATTYAFSLHRRGRNAEAVGILKRLPQGALDDPSIAACYGILLAEHGEKENAKPWLEAAAKHEPQLFPEESAMVAQALGRIL